MTDQPPPKPNNSTPIIDLVISELAERGRVGIARYGTPLQAHNGRDALRDLYDEQLDAVQYTRQVMIEWDAMKERTAGLEAALIEACEMLEEGTGDWGPNPDRIEQFRRLAKESL